jgi:hypothetical protein
VTEFALNTQFGQAGSDLRTSAVHNHGLDANESQIRHVLGEGNLKGLIDHGVATELDYHNAAVKFAQPIQRLDESLCLDAR